jgi:hypothetical protein
MVVDWIYTPTSGYTVFISVSPYTVQKEQEYVWRRRWFFAVVCIGSGPRRTMCRNLWVNSLYNGQINYKGTKTECRLYYCLIEFIDWRYSESCWYFLPSFVNYGLSNLLYGSPPPPPPLQSQSSSFPKYWIAFIFDFLVHKKYTLPLLWDENFFLWIGRTGYQINLFKLFLGSFGVRYTLQCCCTVKKNNSNDELQRFHS